MSEQIDELKVKIDADSMSEELYQTIRKEILKEYGTEHSDEWNLYVTLPNLTNCNCGAPVTQKDNSLCGNCHNVL